MSSFPQLSGKEVVSIFQLLGWKIARQRGSHIILVKENHPATLAVPNHKEIAQGTLRGLIRSAGISTKEFFDVLSK
jgi:predicted RNA binding protein YcfA (HicA-like mRNA interferase family)